jgi:hypothetical protein
MRQTLLTLWMPVLLLSGCVRHPDTPLMEAAQAGDPHGIEDALAGGAHVNQKNGRSLTALIVAARRETFRRSKPFCGMAPTPTCVAA